MAATKNEFDAFVEGYIEAMYWANTMDAESGEFIDFRESADLAEGVLPKIEEDCRSFVDSNIDDLEAASESYSWDSLGSDFALSRNGHGAGFFDRGNEPFWKRLQEAAKVYGEQSFIVGERGEAEIL